MNSKSGSKHLSGSRFLSVGGLVFVCLLFFALTKGELFNSFNLKAIINQSYLYILGCFGMLFLFCQGAVDLSMSSVIALCSIYGARAGAYGALPCLLVCVAIGLAVSVVNGFLYSDSGIPVFIQGLSMSFLIKGVLYRITGGESTINIPDSLRKQFSSMGLRILIVVLFGILTYYLFALTVFGKHSKAIGAGETAAAQSGVSVKKVKRMAFIYCGIATGLVAFLSLVKTGSGGPSTGSGFEFSIMISMVLGGMPMEGGRKSNFLACIIGALLVSVLQNGMVLIGADARVQEIMKGIIFVTVVVTTYRLQLRAEGKGSHHSRLQKKAA